MRRSYTDGLVSYDSLLGDPCPVDQVSRQATPFPKLPARPLSSSRATSVLSLLPRFIKPLPDTIAADDLAYLKRKKALQIPLLDAQDALVTAYIEFVHPFMPILELQVFLGALYDVNWQGGTLSLLLYRAVLCAAVPFVDMSHLEMMGFSDRRVAHKELFQRTRVRRPLP